MTMSLKTKGIRLTCWDCGSQ